MIKEKIMDYDRNKVDDAVLALLYLTFLGDQNVVRAWKSFDWDVSTFEHRRNNEITQ